MKKESKKNTKELHTVTVVAQSNIFKIEVESVKIGKVLEDALGNGLYAIGEVFYNINIFEVEWRKLKGAAWYRSDCANLEEENGKGKGSEKSAWMLYEI